MLGLMMQLKGLKICGFALLPLNFFGGTKTISQGREVSRRLGRSSLAPSPPQLCWKTESMCCMTFPALLNILMDSIKTVAESAWNGHPPLSMQASGVWEAQKGTELSGQM